jgi:predicted Fe-Mo cluster-binding NifX family protein
LARLVLDVKKREDIVMKIAIPTFGDRVSPRFDCAKTFLVVSLDGAKIAHRERLNAADWTAQERVKRLLDLGVDTVICGGIDRWSADSLLHMGIRLIRSITGSIKESLESLQQGELQPGVEVVADTWFIRGKGA